MDVLHQRSRATAAEVQTALPDPPSYSAVRALLRILEDKGHVKHLKEGARYVYLAMQPQQRAAKSALRRVLDTFFGGSVEKAVATLLSDSDSRLSEEELDRLAELIEQAKEGDR